MLREYLNVLLLWFSTTVGEGRLWERLRIYSGKYLFDKSKFYLEKFLNLTLLKDKIVFHDMNTMLYLHHIILILYKDLKRDLNMENYLLYEKFEKRRFITKLRISDHNLPIEKGRHLKIPREKRLCQVCNQIEDEHYFLFVCNKNLDLRNKYLPLIFQDRSNIGEGETIIYILCPSSPVHVGTIGAFIKQSLELRTGNP